MLRKIRIEDLLGNSTEIVKNFTAPQTKRRHIIPGRQSLRDIERQDWRSCSAGFVAYNQNVLLRRVSGDLTSM